MASTVVNQQNAGLATMETDQILDLFNLSEESSTNALPAPPKDSTDAEADASQMVDVETGQVKEKGKKGYLDEIGELWDTGGYEEEFDLGGFLKTMKV